MDNENEMLAEVFRLREAFRSNNLRLEDCKAQFEVIRGLAGRLTALLENEREQQKEEAASRDASSLALSEENEKLAAAKIKTTVKEILDTGDQAAARSALAIKEMNEALSSESSLVSASGIEFIKLRRQRSALSDSLEKAKVSAGENEASLMNALAGQERALSEAFAAGQEAARAAAIAEELRAALNAEREKASALEAKQLELSSRAEELSARVDQMKVSSAEKEASLNEALAAAAEKEAALQEARAAAGEDPSLSAAAFEELRASLDAESARTKALEMEREGLAVRIQSLTVLAEETGKALAEKEELQNKTEELAGVIAELRAALSKNNEKLSQALSERDKLQARLRAATVPAPPGTPCGWVRSLFSRRKHP